MKVLRVYPFFQTELKYLEHYLSRELDGLGYQTTFLSSNQCNPVWIPFIKNYKAFKTDKSRQDNYDIYRIKSFMLGGKPIPYNWLMIYKLLKQNNFDIIHFSGIAGFFNYIVLILIKLSGSKAKVFINDHSNPAVASSSTIGKLYYKINSWVFALFRSNIQKIIAPNEGSISLLKDRYNIPNHQTRIIPLGYDQNIYYHKPEQHHQESQLIIGFAGKIEPRKKIENLFKAIREAGLKNYQLIVVGLVPGNDYSRKLQETAKAMSIQVEFRPLIKEPNKLCDFYNNIDVAVYPGSISITTVEATACGTPVLLYESMPGLEYRVQKGRGQLFKTTNDLASLLKEYAQGKPIDNQEIAVQTKDFSWKRIALRYHEMYAM